MHHFWAHSSINESDCLTRCERARQRAHSHRCLYYFIHLFAPYGTDQLERLIFWTTGRPYRACCPYLNGGPSTTGDGRKKMMKTKNRSADHLLKMLISTNLEMHRPMAAWGGAERNERRHLSKMFIHSVLLLTKEPKKSRGQRILEKTNSNINILYPNWIVWSLICVARERHFIVVKPMRDLVRMRVPCVCDRSKEA